LKTLAAKDPALPARLDAYQRATAEALRWRKQFANQQAKNLAQNLPAATTLLSSKGEVTSHIRPKFYSEPRGETPIAPGTFGLPANFMVYEASDRLAGKPVSEEAMIRLTPTSRSAIVPFDAHHYGNVPVPLASDVESADLQGALVVDDTHGPLSLESAAAVSAAQMQDYVTVSGLIETVHLEAAVTRFIGLPDVAYALVPLGRTPVLEESISPVQQTCWRLDIKPLWAHQGYFTVRTAAATE
jgi:hypothetical protein